MAVQTRDEYNSFNCDYLDGFSYGGGVLGEEDLGSGQGCTDGDLNCLAQYHSWDISLSQTWGPPYDPTSKLWDMTHYWCSGESDAPAVINMESMSFSAFRDNVRALSTTQDYTARDNLYSSVLTALHDEAVFLPITAKRQTAVTNVRVGGFKFGYMEFDLPLANLRPATIDEDKTLPDWGIALVAVMSILFFFTAFFIIMIIVREKAGNPIFVSMGTTTVTSTSSGVQEKSSV